MKLKKHTDMNFFNNMKIGLRLNLVLGLAIVLILTSLGTYIMITERNKIMNDADLRMHEQVEDLTNMVEIELNLNQQQVNIGMEYAEHFMQSLGKLEVKKSEQIDQTAINQVTKAASEIKLDAWYINNEVVQGSNAIVDAITGKIGGTATIFQRIPQGYLRISTNVINNEGNRGTGTFIPNNSPVAKAISNGEAFYGRAFVVNDWYLTGYRPIKVDNEVVGIIYFGVKEKNLANLKKLFKEKEYFTNGYPYMVASNGDVIIHPTKEGASFADEDFFIDMVDNVNTTDKLEYIWEGDKKIQYFKYIERIDSYVSATIYEDDLLTAVRKLRLTLIIAIVLSIISFIIIISVISNSITSVLTKAVSMAKAISKGDLSQTIEIDRKDEVGELVHALNNMIANLKGIVSNITNGANSIASASQQLSGTSESLSQGASEQASSVEEVSSTMEEIAANIEQNTDNASQTEKISLSAQDGIRFVSDKSGEAINANRTISEKINIINDIAFQTNLLALNAAVEAARAGEHGKGFAVVAAEVRKLAENSKIAADQIVTLTQKSLSLSEEAGDAMKETLPNVENSTKLVQEISAASNEQNNGASQVNSAIQQLSNVTQQNAAAAEEMATSSEELAAQASQLIDIISFFSTDNDSKQQGFKSQNKNVAIEKKHTATQENKPVTTKTKSVNIRMNNTQDDNEFESF